MSIGSSLYSSFVLFIFKQSTVVQCFEMEVCVYAGDTCVVDEPYPQGRACLSVPMTSRCKLAASESSGFLCLE